MLTKDELLNINGGSLFRKLIDQFEFIKYSIWEYFYYKKLFRQQIRGY